MKLANRVSALLRGAGSLFDFCPDPRRFDALVPKGTVEDRLRGYGERVEQDLWNAVHAFKGEYEATKETSEKERASRRECRG